MRGTLLNVVTVLIGGSLGLLLGNRLPERIRSTVLHGLGLTTLLIGMQGALMTQNILVVLLSVLVGGILGELLHIEDGLARIGALLERQFQTGDSARFIHGFITASLVFCVGPMTVLGSIQDGLTGDYSTLAVKATLDGFSSAAFASALGPGVLAASLVVLVFQGALTLTAGAARSVLTDPAIREMTATGGVLILGIGVRLLDLKEIRLANFLPAIVIAPLAMLVFNLA